MRVPHRARMQKLRRARRLLYCSTDWRRLSFGRALAAIVRGFRTIMQAWPLAWQWGARFDGGDRMDFCRQMESSSIKLKVLERRMKFVGIF